MSDDNVFYVLAATDKRNDSKGQQYIAIDDHSGGYPYLTDHISYHDRYHELAKANQAAQRMAKSFSNEYRDITIIRVTMVMEEIETLPTVITAYDRGAYDAKYRQPTAEPNDNEYMRGYLEHFPKA